jgi:hypothetical protein
VEQHALFRKDAREKAPDVVWSGGRVTSSLLFRAEASKDRLQRLCSWRARHTSRLSEGTKSDAGTTGKIWKAQMTSEDGGEDWRRLGLERAAEVIASAG